MRSSVWAISTWKCWLSTLTRPVVIANQRTSQIATTPTLLTVVIAKSGLQNPISMSRVRADGIRLD